MLDVASVMIPGGSSKGKESSAGSKIPSADCTCAKYKGPLTVTGGGYPCLSPGSQSMVRLAGLSGGMHSAPVC